MDVYSFMYSRLPVTVCMFCFAKPEKSIIKVKIKKKNTDILNICSFVGGDD